MSALDTCYIYKVPGELLYKLLELLLPELRDTGSLRYPLCQGDISDLCNCRLVCRIFYDSASPLVWRRVKFVLPSSSGSRSPGSSASPSSGTQLSRTVDMARFLVDHVAVREYVRLLSITTNGPNMVSAITQRAISGLLVAAPLLLNLRVLNIHEASTVPAQLLVKLLLLPSMHTVRLWGIDCSSLPVDRSLFNANISRLGLHRCRHPEKLYALMPSLRAFDVGMQGDVFEALPVCNSLQEASFQINLPGWDRVERSLTTWRHARRNSPLSLTEVMICQWNFNPKIKDLNSIIVPFAGNPLTKLIIFYIEEPTPSLLENIVQLFPNLKELSLLSDEELAQWPSEVSTYGNILRRLEGLELLEWNLYDGGDHNICGSWDMVNEDGLIEITLVLAETCSQLRKVNFCLVIDGLMEIEITRDVYGKPSAMDAVYSDSWVYCTSSWKAKEFLDI